MIEARNLVKTYKPKKGVPVRALNDISLKLPDTGMVFLLGKSGSGKSTLLNVLGGLDSYDSGEIIINGTSSKNFKQQHYDSYRNTYVGFIFQEYNILEDFTVGANIALAIELQGRKATNQEINEILEEVDLTGYGNRKPNELSGGQKQRVAIARALIKKPEIIMADEPTGALDSNTGKQVFDTLKKLSKDKLVLIVSHDREFAEQYADRIIELADGNIISDVQLEESEGAVGKTFNAINYMGDEIKIAKGYQLTDADRVAINAYLAKLSTDATLRVSQENKREKVDRKFVTTDESAIKADSEGDFKLIKSKLSLRHAFKIGGSGLKHKKFRLVVTILLSFVAFTLFGLADTIAAYDSVKTTVNSIVDTGINYASFVKQKEYTYDYGDGYSYTYSSDSTMSKDDLKTIQDNTGVTVKGVYPRISNGSNEGISFSSYIKTDSQTSKYLNVYSNSFSGLVEFSANDLNSFGYTITGTLPDGSKNEIAISDYTLELFKNVGYTYINSENKSETITINSANDIIGKTLSFSSNNYSGGGYVYTDYTITGVVDTGFDVSRYDTLINSDGSMMSVIYMYEIESIKNYSASNVAFVGEGFIDKLIADNSASGTYLSNAYVALTNYKYVEDTYYDVDKTNNNIDISYSYVSKLSDYTGDIAWVGTQKTSLAKDEVVVDDSIVDRMLSPYQALNESNVTGEYYTDAQNYNSNITTLIEFMNNIYSIAEYKYQQEKQESDYWNMPPSYFFDYYKKVYNAYPALANYYLSPSDVEKYSVNYSYTTETYDGQTQTIYSSLNEMRSGYSFTSFYSNYTYDYVAAKYAKSHETEMKAWADANNADNDYYTFSVQNYISQYYNYLDAFKYSTSLTAEETTLYNQLLSEASQVKLDVLNSALQNSSSSGLYLNVDSYSNNYEDTNRSVKIVGVIVRSADKSLNQIIIMDDETVDGVTGGTENIYKYAVGSLDVSNRSVVTKCVEFSDVTNDGVNYSFKNSVMTQMDLVNSILGVLGQVFLYVGIGFAVFAAIMLSNFIATSISYKRQEIGILRAIGSRSTDVFKIFFAESFIIAMINYVLSLIATGIVTVVLNNVLRSSAGLLITILSFGIREVLLLLAISLGVALIATYLPVRKIAHKKPIDAIRKR